MPRFVCLTLGFALVLCAGGSVRAQPKAVSDKQMTLWVEKVSQLKPDEQDAAFRAKMGELNSKLDTAAIKIVSDKDGVVREMTIPGKYAKDIRPVALFRELEKLDASSTLGYTSAISDLSALRALTKLKELNLNDTSVTDLSALAALPIEKLWLEHTPVTDITALKKMPLTLIALPQKVPAKQLTVLTGKPLTVFVTAGSGPDNAKEVKAIFGNAKLETYGVARSNIESLEPFANMPLKSLRLGDAPNLTSLAPLKNCNTLKSLQFFHSHLVTDLTPIAKKSLLNLHFAHCRKITDLTPLKDAPGLTGLNVAFTGVTDLTPVAGLKNLDGLFIEDMKVNSLKPIAGLPHVHTLRLRGLEVKDQDFAPITTLPRLIILYLDVTPVNAPLLNVKKIPSLKEVNGKSIVPPK